MTVMTHVFSNPETGEPLRDATYEWYLVDGKTQETVGFDENGTQYVGRRKGTTDANGRIGENGEGIDLPVLVSPDPAIWLIVVVAPLAHRQVPILFDVPESGPAKISDHIRQVPGQQTWPVVGKGDPGKTAYEVAVDEGFVGTEDDWLDSLVGPPGLVPRGEWDAVTAYVVNDMVTLDGSTYVASAPSTGSEPPSADWIRYVQRGEAPLDPTLYDVFTGDPDGPPRAQALSGQTYQQAAASGTTSPEIVDGTLTNTDTSGGSASYSNVDLGERVTRIGGRFVLGPSGGTHSGAACFILWDRLMAGPIPNSPCHFVIGDTTWTYSKWVEGVGATSLASGAFSPALATDYATIHETDLFFDGNTVTINLPDGTTETITDASIGGDGDVACFEVFQIAQTDPKAGFVEVWADVGEQYGPRPNYMRRAETERYVAEQITAAQSTVVSYDTLWMPAKQFDVNTGSPTLGKVQASNWPAWLLDGVAIEAVVGVEHVPDGWNTFAVDLWWTNAGAGAGGCRFNIDRAFPADGNSITVPSSAAAVTVTAPAQDVIKKTTLVANVSATSGEVLFLRLIRDPTHAGDTLTNDIGVVGILVRRMT